MGRWHLFELEDQPWLPAPIRGGMTSYLAFMGNLDPPLYQAFCEALASALRATGETRLLDLCSGSAGPLPSVLAALDARGVRATARLTDRFPNPVAFEGVAAASGGRIDFVTEPIDATDVPPTQPGFRVLCNAFHHFRPEHARGILADAVAKGQGIAVFEGVERRLPSMVCAALGVVGVPLASLVIRPWRWDRALFTWVVPIIPLATAWDGVVSCLRVYDATELRALVAEVPGGSSYVWHIERTRVRGPFGTTWLVGHPKQRGTDDDPRSVSER